MTWTLISSVVYISRYKIVSFPYNCNHYLYFIVSHSLYNCFCFCRWQVQYPLGTCLVWIWRTLNKYKYKYRPTHAENKKFRRIRRRYQTNQSRNTPNIRAYKIPQLQSQFPSNPKPTQPERSTPSYLQIHWPNRHSTKFSLTKARKMTMRSHHHHAV